MGKRKSSPVGEDVSKAELAVIHEGVQVKEVDHVNVICAERVGLPPRALTVLGRVDDNAIHAEVDADNFEVIGLELCGRVDLFCHLRERNT